MDVRGGDNPVQVAVLFGVLGTISVSVLFWTHLPALNDYPNHLARVYILANLPNSAVLQHFYRNVMSAQPNLAMDIAVPLLAKLMPVQVAGKVFIAATLLVTAGGTVALHRAIHGRWSVWPCIAFLFVYHRLLLWGLLNFCFGVGLAMFGLAAWIGLRKQPVWQRIPVSIACAAAIYLSHLYAFGIYAIALAGIELWYLVRPGALIAHIRDLLIAGVQFVLPLIWFVFFSGTPASASETRWGTIWRKFEAPFDTIYQYHLVFDMACLFVVAALVVLGLVRRRIVFANMMVPVLALLVLTYLAMPDELFTGWGADRRLPIAIALASIAALDWRPARSWWREPAAALLAAMFLVRMALLVQAWHAADGVYDRYVEAFDRLPRGARLLSYTLHPEEESLSPVPITEIACLSVVLRDTFVPVLFTSPPLSAEALAFAPGVEKIAIAVQGDKILLPHDIERARSPSSTRLRGMFAESVLSNFDYVLINRPDVLPAGTIPAGLTIVYRGPGFELLAIPHRTSNPA